MATKYFGMDSFNRDTAYCCNTATTQTANKYVDLEGLKAYDNIAMSRDISRIVLNKVDCKSLVYATSAFGLKRLKRADLNLVYRWLCFVTII